MQPEKKRALPTGNECLAMLKKAGASESVVSHCMRVKALAVRMAELSKADVELVTAGALLHDIGRSVTHGIFHAVEGVRIAREMGLPEEIVRIISRHIGAGITEEEAAILGLPPGDYIPQTLEEKIVAHADNLEEGGKYITLDGTLDNFRRVGVPPHVLLRTESLHYELSKRCGTDLNELVRKVANSQSR